MNETKPSPPDWLLNDIAEASRDASRAYLFYIGFLFYCVLTVVGTSDLQLVLKNQAVNLPIINVSVSINSFFVIAPLLAIALFIYFQIYLSRLDYLINELRNSYASTDKGRLSQWMMNIAEGSAPGAIGKLQTIIVKFALWWTLPIVLIVFATWFLKKHSPFLSYIVAVLYPIVGTIIVFLFWCARERVELKGFIRDPWKIALASFVFSIQVLLIFLIFFVLSPEKGILAPKNRARSLLVDLGNQKLVTEPNPDYPGLYWADLKGMHLEGANLTSSILKRADLRYAQLQSANLVKTNFEKADLSDANLEGASLGDANLKQANLGFAYLGKANLQGANLQGADLQETQLSQAWIVDADLSKANLKRALLKGTFLMNANFKEANLESAYLEEANLQGANLQGANLQGANLQGANLEFANLREALNLTIKQLSNVKSLYGAQLEPPFMKQIQELYPHLFGEPNLQGATLYNADLQGASLTNANLQGAYLGYIHLQKADLQGANLRFATLTNANLQGANLRGANLQEASLYNANFQGADLRDADLQGSDLGNANLQEASLTNANLQGADLRQGIYVGALTIEQLCSTKTLYRAKLDQSSKEQVEKNCLHLLEEPKPSK